MTRRLQFAGLGLCAFLLPACLGTSRPDPNLAGSKGYVLVDRPGGNPAYRKNVVAAPPRETDPRYRHPIVIVEPDKKPEAEAPIVQLPPEIKPEHQAGHAQPASADAASAETIKPPVESPMPGDGPRLPGTAADSVRTPDWPKIGGVAVVEPMGMTMPETRPKLDLPMNSNTMSAGSPMALPLLDDVKPPAVGVSLRLPDPVAPTIAPNVAPPSGDETIIVKAIKAFQANRPQAAVELLKQLDPANQEVLMYLMPLMVRLGEGNVSTMPPDELAMLIDRLQNAAGMLKTKAAMRADRVCFCRVVRKFADVDPYDPRHEFRPGDMVFLYAELKNFTCEPIVVPPKQPLQRGFAIRLAATLELRDARNNLVWRTDLTKTDFAQSPPHDYYHTYRFCVPERLPAGTYTLWLNVTDKPTGRAVRTPVEMHVGHS